MNPQKIAKSRALLNKNLRNFFDSDDFIEVETPIMTPYPGMEPYLAPFETNFHNPLKKKIIPLYLNTSPELQMKKLLAQGFEKIYNITKVFRNTEQGGGLHNPEFTMLEWYRQKSNYEELMDDCEKLITTLAKKSTITYQNTQI
ncbi:amino acid--tRNA ligase-related protein, partial [Patescibacteria group bacterium]